MTTDARAGASAAIGAMPPSWSEVSPMHNKHAVAGACSEYAKILKLSVSSRLTAFLEAHSSFVSAEKKFQGCLAAQLPTNSYVQSSSKLESFREPWRPEYCKRVLKKVKCVC